MAELPPIDHVDFAPISVKISLESDRNAESLKYFLYLVIIFDTFFGICVT